MIGRTISHYKILSQLGEGGMGVVYKAEDSKLERTVALKFLAPHLVQDSEVRKRFEREAKAAASLSHPNVCHVYEIDEAEGKTFIAMAYVEGESLDKNIERGPLGLEEALDIAQQIAKGLEAAHERGIFHRDIKPENVIVDLKGHVTIMDFGLAQLTEASRLTKADQTMGTTAYMSPEQTDGSGTDHRTDIWSLGVVLYEMITGQQPFKGEYGQAVMYSILNEEPEPVTALRTGVPMELEVFVGKCLQKVSEKRYLSAGELAQDLSSLRDKLKSGGSNVLVRQPVPEVAPGATMSGIARYWWLPWALLAATALLLLAVSSIHFTEPEARRLLRRFALTPPGQASSNLILRSAAISPNGKHVVFVNPEELWVFDLDAEEPRVMPVPNTATAPFWSPESDRIGFAANGQLKTIAVEGGPVTRICDLPSENFGGASWSPDGELIVFSSGIPAALYEVAERGGLSRKLTSTAESDQSEDKPSGEVVAPHFLPLAAGRRVLFYAVGQLSARVIVLEDLNTGRWKTLGAGDSPFYSTSGHLIFQPAVLKKELWARPFSLDRLEFTDPAFPIAEHGEWPTIASDETLAYLDARRENQLQLTWFDRQGVRVDQIGSVEPIGQFALSPDAQRVAVSVGEGDSDLWIWSTNRPEKTRLTSSAARDYRPVWSPSGETLAFSSAQAGNVDIYLAQIGGSHMESAVATTVEAEQVSDWSNDGEYIVYGREDPVTGDDLWYLESTDGGASWIPRPFLQTAFNELAGQLSPDGRHIAYVSDETGVQEIYVREFPGSGRRHQISTTGGRKPRWGPSGSELFYVEGRDTLMAVSVSTQPSFSPGDATPLFRHTGLGRGGPYPRYDVSADGQRFLVAEAVERTPDPKIRIVENWYEEFRDRELD